MPSLSKIRSNLTFYKAGKWLEYLLLLGVAILVAALTFKFSYKIGMIIAMASLALLVLFFCFYHLEIGVYGMFVFAFLIAFIDRMDLVQFSLTTVLMALPFVFLGILLSIQIFKRDKKWMVWHPIIFIYFASVLYGIVQVFNPLMDSIPGWISYMRGALIFFVSLVVFLYIFKDLKSIRFFFKFILSTFFITALYGFIQQKFGFTAFEYRWIYGNSRIANLFSLPGEGIRKFSFLTDPANFGTLMAAGCIGAIAVASGPYRRKKKILLGFASFMMLLGASYSGTRTAYLMIIAGLALFTLMTFYQKRSRILAACVIGFLLLILFIPIYGNVTINRVRSAFKPPSTDASYDTRNMNRHWMQPFMHSHPFGSGVNTTMGAGIKYNPHSLVAGFPPDSQYFKMALEQGWVGLILNCVFFFMILFYTVHYFYRSKNKEIKTYYGALAVMLCAMMLGAYTQFTITSIPQNFVFIAFIACVIKLHTFEVAAATEQPIQNPVNKVFST